VAPPRRFSQPTDLARTLLERADTVTHFLERITGEPMVAEVVRQYPIASWSDSTLGVPAGRPMIHRIVVLKGRASALPYLYAESTFVPERLPSEARVQLDSTSDPIGRVLVAHGFELTRKVLPWAGHPDPSRAFSLGEQTSEVVWARAYLLLLDGDSVFVIRERFFRAVLDALDRSGRA
jgi:chorismate-pyruvate lyase